MATAPELPNLVQIIKDQARGSEESDNDAEWNLFVRFGESINRFASQQMPNETARKELFDKFSQQKTHRGRVSFLLDQVQFQEVIDMLVKEVSSEKSHGKCSEKAKLSRDMGNQFFRAKMYERALESYAEVRCKSPICCCAKC